MNGETVNEHTGTPALNEALSKFQAALPRVGKGETGKVEGKTKDGKPFSYSYKYADLADISAVALPLLGKFGLAFTSKPTMKLFGDRLQFVLHYKLTHSSGEADEGFYSLPDPGQTDAQKVGSAVTYARRYCLCAITGIHPDGEDDDAAAASQPAARVGGARETGTSSRSRAANGSVSRPAQAPRAPSPSEVDDDAQEYADQAHQARTIADLQTIHQQARDGHKLAAVIRNPADDTKLGGLGQYLNWRKSQVEESDKAFKDLGAAASAAKITIENLELHVKTVTGATLEGASAAQLRQATEALKVGAAA